MIKVSENTNILNDAEVDKVMLLLEKAYHETGNNSVFKVMEVFMNDTYNEQNNYICNEK